MYSKAQTTQESEQQFCPLPSPRTEEATGGLPSKVFSASFRSCCPLPQPCRLICSTDVRVLQTDSWAHSEGGQFWVGATSSVHQWRILRRYWLPKKAADSWKRFRAAEDYSGAEREKRSHYRFRLLSGYSAHFGHSPSAPQFRFLHRSVELGHSHLANRFLKNQTHV